MSFQKLSKHPPQLPGIVEVTEDLNPEISRQLIKALSKYHYVSKELEQKITGLLFMAKVKKNTCLVNKGEHCKHLYFLVKGILLFFAQRNNKKIISYIAINGDFVTSINGMYGEMPSDDCICAGEDSLILGLEVEELFYLCDHFPELNTIMFRVMCSCFKKTYERLNMIRLGTAKEKYLYLMDVFSGHFDRISCLDLANYINIRLETLLRIKKEIERFSANLWQSNLLSTLESHIEEHKDFLDKKITLGELAKRINVSPYELNFFIKLRFRKKFNDYIKFLRIEYIKDRFQNDRTWRRLTIEAIGNEAGFKCRSTFFSEFKRYTGCTPGKYIEKIEQGGCV